MTDLAIVGGQVIDPGRGIDARLGVAVTDGHVAALGDVGPAAETIDATGLVLLPGLVDLHTHLYHGVSHYGIDPDANCLRRGVTTAVDAGSSGAQTFPGFRRYVIEGAKTRIFAFLHVAVQGMITSLVGELEDLRWASPAQAVGREVLRQGGPGHPVGEAARTVADVEQNPARPGAGHVRVQAAI